MAAGSCRPPTPGRRHRPPSLTPAAARAGLGLGAGGVAKGEPARGVLAGGVPHPLVLTGLWEDRREAGVAVAARIIVLEVATAADAGTAQEQVRIELVGLEIDRHGLAG